MQIKADSKVAALQDVGGGRRAAGGGVWLLRPDVGVARIRGIHI